MNPYTTTGELSPWGRRVILGSIGAGVLINILLHLGAIHL